VLLPDLLRSWVGGALVESFQPRAVFGERQRSSAQSTRCSLLHTGAQISRFMRVWGAPNEAGDFAFRIEQHEDSGNADAHPGEPVAEARVEVLPVRKS